MIFLRFILRRIYSKTRRKLKDRLRKSYSIIIDLKNCLSEGFFMYVLGVVCRLKAPRIRKLFVTANYVRKTSHVCVYS